MAEEEEEGVLEKISEPPPPATEESTAPPPAETPAPVPASQPPRGTSIAPTSLEKDEHESEEFDFVSVSEGVDSEGRPSGHKGKRPTEDIAMRLPPRVIIDKLSRCYKDIVGVREDVRTLEKEFGKLDRKRNRWKATEEELKLRVVKKKELQERQAVLDLLNLKITKLKEAAQAKNIKADDLPPEPPPLDEDDEDVCLPDDKLPRVIVCNGFRSDRNDKLPGVPKIVVCLDDRCKPPPPDENKQEEPPAIKK
jgi:hypothetical protein